MIGLEIYSFREKLVLKEALNDIMLHSGNCLVGPIISLIRPFECPAQVRVCSSDKMTPIYFISLSKGWNKYDGSMGRVHRTCYLILLCAFLAFVFLQLLFFIIKFVFLMKFEISATEHWPIRNEKWWFPTVSGTVCPNEQLVNA